MKKLILIIMFLVSGYIGCQAQYILETCANVRGYWTDWIRRNTPGYSYNNNTFDFQMEYNSYNTFCGMEFRYEYDKPWEWCFKFTIDNYVKPDKKTRKEHLKSNAYYEYSGWVEYYVSDDYPTIQKVLERYEFPMIKPYGDSKRALRKARATIKIQPYKKEPTCFNIFFDGVAVGIAFDKWPFPKEYVVK